MFLFQSLAMRVEGDVQIEDADQAKLSFQQDVMNLYFSRDYQGSLQKAQQWVQIEPENPDAHFWVAKALQRNRKLAEADQEAIRSVELKYSNTVEILLLRSTLLRDLGRYDESLEFSRKARDLEPLFWMTWQEIGQTLKRQKKWREATPHFEKAMTLAPGEFWPVHLLGIARLLDNRATEAVELLQQSLKIHPNDPDSRLGLGFAWLVLQNKAKANLQYRLLKGKDILRAVVLLEALNQFDTLGVEEMRLLAIEKMAGQ